MTPRKPGTLTTVTVLSLPLAEPAAAHNGRAPAGPARRDRLHQATLGMVE